MIESALRFLLGLKRNEVVEVDGKKYATCNLTPVADPIPAGFNVHTLSGLVRYVKECEADHRGEIDKMVITVVGPEEVVLWGNPDSENFEHRRKFLTVTRQEGSFSFGKFYDHEMFMIYLESMFVKTDMLEQVHTIAKIVDVSEGIKFTDDGFAQQIAVRQGVATGGKTATINNPFTLMPIRTFTEVDQPESPFVLRLRKGAGGNAEIALFEADGGNWKVDATRNIGEYLQNQLGGLKVPIVW